MKVLIDADGCAVADICIDLCRKFDISCFLFCDTSHELKQKDAHILIFDKGADSVDFALVSRVSAGDIVITQDYGLASMCLAKNARVLHQDGWEYTSENIDVLLLVRHNSRKLRASGERIKGPKKRTSKQNQQFQISLEHLLQISVHG